MDNGSVNLGVRIGPLTLKNPVGTASGTFGYGGEYEKLMDVAALGCLFTKAVTPEPREGNDIPRMVETPSGLLNSIGLANVGLEAFVRDKVPQFDRLGTAIFVNVAGSSPEDYELVVETLESVDAVHGFEINVSCPNVKKGCLAFGTDPAMVERLTASLRGRTRKALVVKLTPNTGDITAIARAAENGGADALTTINTLTGMVIDIKKRKAVLPAGTGGLSGPAIRPVGVALAYRTARAVKIPIFGVGGIMNASDAIQYLLAGASAVQVGTGTFVDPTIPEAVIAGIRSYMEENKIGTIAGFHQFMK